MKETVTLKVERLHTTYTQRFSRSAIMGGKEPALIQTEKTAEYDFNGNEQLTQLLEDMYDGVVVTDIDGNIQHVNSRICEFVGADKAFLATRNIVDLISGSDENLVYAVIEAINSDAYAKLDASCRRLDGSTFPVDVTVNALYITEDGMLCFFLRNVTARLDAQRALATMQNRCHSILESLCDWYWEIDRDGVILFCSKAAAETLGCNHDELCGKSLFEFVEATQRDVKLEQFRRIVDGQALLDRFLVDMGTEGGTMIKVELSGVPTMIEDGAIKGYQGIAVVVPDSDSGQVQ